MVAVFDYRAAGSVSEALDLLAQYGDDAKVLAGGQSLIALINLGLVQPSALVDISRAPDLNRLTVLVRETGSAGVDGSLVVGAATTHATALSDDRVRRACPLLAEALALIGDPQVRNRGTVGGSIAHADPVAELPTVAVCLGAVMHVESKRGAREVPATEFFQGYLTTALGPGELLTEVRFPTGPPGVGVAFQELVRRKGDFAIVAAASSVGVAADGTCSTVRLALAGVGPTPIQAAGAAGVLVGRSPTPDLIQEAARAACVGIEPESDVMASADYRRAMAEVYARRALTQAVERARQPGQSG